MDGILVVLDRLEAGKAALQGEGCPTVPNSILKRTHTVYSALCNSPSCLCVCVHICVYILSYHTMTMMTL